MEVTRFSSRDEGEAFARYDPAAGEVLEPDESPVFDDAATEAFVLGALFGATAKASAKPSRLERAERRLEKALRRLERLGDEKPEKGAEAPWWGWLLAEIVRDEKGRFAPGGGKDKGGGGDDKSLDTTPTKAAKGRSRAAAQARRDSGTAREATAKAKSGQVSHEDAAKLHDVAAAQHEAASKASRSKEHREAHAAVAAAHKAIAEAHRAEMTKPKELHISEIKIPGGGMREESRAHFERVYALGKAAGKTATQIAHEQPPVRINVYGDDRPALNDGRHRLEAAQKHGAKSLPATIHYHDEDANETRVESATIKLSKRKRGGQ